MMTCPVCGDIFTPDRPTQKYCDALCYRIQDNAGRPMRGRNETVFPSGEEYRRPVTGPGDTPVRGGLGEEKRCPDPYRVSGVQNHLQRWVQAYLENAEESVRYGTAGRAPDGIRGLIPGSRPVCC